MKQGDNVYATIGCIAILLLVIAVVLVIVFWEEITYAIGWVIGFIVGSGLLASWVKNFFKQMDKKR